MSWRSNLCLSSWNEESNVFFAQGFIERLLRHSIAFEGIFVFDEWHIQSILDDAAFFERTERTFGVAKGSAKLLQEFIQAFGWERTGSLVVELAPSLVEVIVLSDDGQILLLGVIGLFEVGEDDGQEKVEHDVGDHKRKELKVGLGTGGATTEGMPTNFLHPCYVSLLFHGFRIAFPYIVLRQPHSQLLHDRVPCLACHTAEQRGEALREAHEIGVDIVLWLLYDFGEHLHAHHCEDELEQQEQAADVDKWWQCLQ